MSQGGLTVVFVIAGLLNVSLAVYILVKYKGSIRASDPDRANRYQASVDSRGAKAGNEQYNPEVLVSILRDQLAHSREDFSELQEEVERLTVQVAGLRADFLFTLTTYSKESKIDIGRLEIELGKINNRLDNYRLLLSGIQERLK
jgi:hypothetical protein